MQTIKNFYKTVIKYDLINKFSYKKLEQLPKIKSINLKYTKKSYNLKELSLAILALELITKKKAKLTFKKTLLLSNKTQNDYKINYNVILNKTLLDEFLFRILSNILTKIKNLNNNKIISIKKNQSKRISFNLLQPIMFNEIEKHHNLFKNLPSLNINFIINDTTSHHKEITFLLISHKLPVFINL